MQIEQDSCGATPLFGTPYGFKNGGFSMSFQAAFEKQILPNPLDILEEIVTANEWLFDRANDDELIVELSGRWCHYRMFFVWQKEIGALQFSCQFDMKVPPAKCNDVHDLLAMLNDRLWLGHFN